MKQTKTVLRDPVYMVDFSVFKPEDELRINLNKCADSCWKWKHPGGLLLLLLVQGTSCTDTATTPTPTQDVRCTVATRDALQCLWQCLVKMQPPEHGDLSAAANNALARPCFMGSNVKHAGCLRRHQTMDEAQQIFLPAATYVTFCFIACPASTSLALTTSFITSSFILQSRLLLLILIVQ
jgi:hypothetical protein